VYIEAAMATLSTTIPTLGTGPVIIVPNKSFPPSNITPAAHLSRTVLSRRIANRGVAPGAAVSMVLPNSYEFIVAFLAASWQRAIAARLNPAYKQEEFDFYIADLSSAVTLVPHGLFRQNGPAIRTAQKNHAAIAECCWNGREVELAIKDHGKLMGKGSQSVQKALPDDITLVLHTSGTTGRPKAV